MLLVPTRAPDAAWKGPVQGRNEGGAIPRATNDCGGRRKVPTSIFFNTVNLLQKELRFEHGGAKLASCPERHLASLRPWVSIDPVSVLEWPLKRINFFLFRV